MYGRSESEHTLIGGDAGRESDCCDEEPPPPSDWPLTAIVLPRCSRAAVADIGRLWTPNGRWAAAADEPACDGGPLRLLPAVARLPLAPAAPLADAPLPDCDCSEPIGAVRSETTSVMSWSHCKHVKVVHSEAWRKPHRPGDTFHNS